MDVTFKLSKIIKSLKRRINYCIYHSRLIYNLIINSKRYNAYVFGAPMHINMGDQAQSLCIKIWIEKNYPQHHVTLLVIPHTTDSIIHLIRKIIKSEDLIFFHSGYHLTDLYAVKEIYMRCITIFKDYQIISFPQTIFFKKKTEMEKVVKTLKSHPNYILLCRDLTSYQTALESFDLKKIYLFPDIVTSLIGKYYFDNLRNGILFCIRNDIEAFYSKTEINKLKARFSNLRIEETDTSIPNKFSYINKRRLNILESIFKYYSSFEVIITDRYHGTIFSLIANTPVIVLSSTDHKLSSGVRWFPKDIFGHYINYAHNLDEAHQIAIKILNMKDLNYKLPPYFEDNYYSKLKKIINE